jgi:hypothetical protein
MKSGCSRRYATCTRTGDAQRGLPIHAPQSAWKPYIPAAIPPLRRRALLLTRGEPRRAPVNLGRGAILLRGWGRLIRGHVHGLAFTLTLQPLALIFQTFALVPETLTFTAVVVAISVAVTTPAVVPTVVTATVVTTAEPVIETSAA